LFAVDDIAEPIIYPGDGGAFTSVSFRLLVFRPFPGEILTGRVRSCDSVSGIRVSLEFFDDCYIPPALMKPEYTFDEEKGTWAWLYSAGGGAEGHAAGEAEAQRLEIRRGDAVRFVVQTAQFNSEQDLSEEVFASAHAMNLANATAAAAVPGAAAAGTPAAAAAAAAAARPGQTVPSFSSLSEVYMSVRSQGEDMCVCTAGVAETSDGANLPAAYAALAPYSLFPPARVRQGLRGPSKEILSLGGPGTGSAGRARRGGKRECATALGALEAVRSALARGSTTVSIGDMGGGSYIGGGLNGPLNPGFLWAAGEGYFGTEIGGGGIDSALPTAADSQAVAGAKGAGGKGGRQYTAPLVLIGRMTEDGTGSVSWWAAPDADADAEAEADAEGAQGEISLNAMSS
jgi:DNA-directed RNA polymerase subunit E'/Rpb7